jgi:predicted ester cyclase
MDVRYDIVAEGDRVAVRWTMHGRHTGEYLGVSPTGRQVEHHAMVIFRGEDDKIAERWGVFDALGLLRQLGVAPQRPAR